MRIDLPQGTWYVREVVAEWDEDDSCRLVSAGPPVVGALICHPESPTAAAARVTVSGPVASPAVTLSASDLAAIRTAEKTLAEAFESADPTAWVDSYTQDAIFVGPGMAAIEGRLALRERAAQISVSSMEISADSTLGAGDFAATLGRATWVSGPKDSGAPTVSRRFLMVWRRESDGAWRIARELLNDDA